MLMLERVKMWMNVETRIRASQREKFASTWPAVTRVNRCQQNHQRLQRLQRQLLQLQHHARRPPQLLPRQRRQRQRQPKKLGLQCKRLLLDLLATTDARPATATRDAIALVRVLSLSTFRKETFKHAFSLADRYQNNVLSFDYERQQDK